MEKLNVVLKLYFIKLKINLIIGWSNFQKCIYKSHYATSRLNIAVQNFNNCAIYMGCMTYTIFFVIIYDKQ